jgi:copper resistance protein B
MRRRPIATFFALVFSVGISTAGAQHEGHQPQKPAPPAQKPAQPAQEAAPPGSTDHSEHQKTVPELPSFIPPVTDEDRKAAFPDVEGHAVHDRSANYFVLFDQLEWQAEKDGSGINLDSKGWFGWDRDRLWFRAEGDSENGDVAAAEAQMFYGRQISRWWDLVAGVRQDFRPGPSRTFAAVGIQGLAPYWFEVEGTAYFGSSGMHLRGEVEYELLLTNRLVLQPLLEVEIFGKSDPERGIGAGLSTTEAGFRLRYEFRRELAPYIGVTWNNKFGGTADFAETSGEHTNGARFVTGLRAWF